MPMLGPDLLRGRGLGRARSASSGCFEPVDETVGWVVSSGRPLGRSGSGECLFLQLEIGLKVDLDGVDAVVAGPDGDDAVSTPRAIAAPRRLPVLDLRKRLLFAIFGCPAHRYVGACGRSSSSRGGPLGRVCRSARNLHRRD